MSSEKRFFVILIPVGHVGHISKTEGRIQNVLKKIVRNFLSVLIFFQRWSRMDIFARINSLMALTSKRFISSEQKS